MGLGGGLGWGVMLQSQVGLQAVCLQAVSTPGVPPTAVTGGSIQRDGVRSICSNDSDSHLGESPHDVRSLRSLRSSAVSGGSGGHWRSPRLEHSGSVFLIEKRNQHDQYHAPQVITLYSICTFSLIAYHAEWSHPVAL